MIATATQKKMTREMEELKGKLKATWMTGHYDVFARFMEADAVEFYRRLALPAGVRLLDVGCGAGQLALIAARAGAAVTGCDIATNWLEKQAYKVEKDFSAWRAANP